MAKMRTKLPRTLSPAVTPQRAARVYRLLLLLSSGPQDRERLTRRLRLDVRGFYRDLELLRTAGIEVTLTSGCYSLEGKVKDSVARLPLPDPHLTLGEALQLAKGRGPAPRKLRNMIGAIIRQRTV